MITAIKYIFNYNLVYLLYYTYLFTISLFTFNLFRKHLFE